MAGHGIARQRIAAHGIARQRKSKVDAVGALHRQVQRLQAGVGGDAARLRSLAMAAEVVTGIAEESKAA